jgi:hypothetical protein
MGILAGAAGGDLWRAHRRDVPAAGQHVLWISAQGTAQ